MGCSKGEIHTRMEFTAPPAQSRRARTSPTFYKWRTRLAATSTSHPLPSTRPPAASGAFEFSAGRGSPSPSTTPPTTSSSSSAIGTRPITLWVSPPHLRNQWLRIIYLRRRGLPSLKRGQLITNNFRYTSLSCAHVYVVELQCSDDRL